MTTSKSYRHVRLALLLILTLTISGLVPLTVGSTTAQAAFGAMIQPVDGRVTGVLTNRCGTHDPSHQGVDLAGNDGVPIRATYSGTVTQAGEYGAYGFMVSISHPSNYRSLYSHMRAAPTVKIGQTVTRGQIIGYVGSTGRSTGPHLHFELWQGTTNLGDKLGFVCGTRVTGGTAMPYSFPGLGTSAFDYTSDGIDDLISVSIDGWLSLSKGAGNGTLTEPTRIGPGWENMSQLSHGDFTGDGIGDLIAVTYDGTLRVYQGTGQGGFSRVTAPGQGWDVITIVEAGADFNGDGASDIVATTMEGRLRIYAGNGAGGFSGEVMQHGYGWEAARFIVTGDFNGDGKGDVLAVLDDGNLYLYRGDGSFGLSPRLQVGTGWASFTALTGGGDYNNDGRADLLGRAADGLLMLYTGTSGGGFTGPFTLTPAWDGHLFLE